MKLQEYLIVYGLQKLIDTYAITAKYHKKYEYLVQLTYDQLKTPKNDITNDCRGIIFDSRDWSIVAWPFTRFNDFEPKVKNIKFDFTNFKAFEKIDGSMMSVYWYEGEWHVVSKSVPDASGFVWNSDPDIKIKYSEYFWNIWDSKGYLMPLEKDWTYIFEFKFPSEKQFLTKTDKESITLIGIRNIKTGIEISISDYDHQLVMNKIHCNWKFVSDYFLTFKDVLEISRELNPLESEGFVICDSNFNRFKVKSPLYDRIALLRRYNGDFKHDQKVQNENYKRLCSIIKHGINNEHLETFLKFYPDCKSDFFKILKIYKKILNDLSKEIQKTKSLTKPQLGLYCKKSNFEKLLFPLHDFLNLSSKNTIEEFFYDMDNSNFVKLIKNYK